MRRSEAEARFARLKWRRAFDKWQRKAVRWIETIKAGFDPNQPRVPAGSREGGRWTRTGGATRVAQAQSGKPKKPPQKKPEKPKLKLPAPREPQRGGPPLEPPPQIPKQRPPTNKERISVARRVARWLTVAVAGRHIRAAVFVKEVLEETGWMDEFRGFVQSAFDPPKSLEQLQKEAFEPAPGYDIHHIVEQMPARNAGFPDSLINAPENRVRIPRIRHWRSTGGTAEGTRSLVCSHPGDTCETRIGTSA